LIFLLRLLQDSQIPCSVIHYPEEIAWNKLLNSDNDQTNITLTGISTSAFQWFNNLFQTVHNENSPWVSLSGHIKKVTKNMGQKQLVYSLDILALC
jgi:hypothetical protein